MRARYLLLLMAVGAAALLGAMTVRSAQGEARRTLTFTAPRPQPATNIRWTCRRAACRLVTKSSAR